VSFSGPGIITGRLDFAPGQTNQFSNNNGSNVGPPSVNTSVAAVASAISTVTSLSSALGALTGTPIVINGTQTINESAGMLHTVNGVTYSVFTVTSYGENDGKILTINGDESGNPVVFNFPNGNFNLGGDVALTGNGLNDDKVIWNFTSSNQNIQLNNNASSFPSMAFHGIILAPNDGIHLVNANLSGRIFGGDNQDMQLVSGLSLHAPIINTATVSGSNVTSTSSSATITVTGPFLPYAHFI
jgi:choice-of-anchor A domain-containing protein